MYRKHSELSLGHIRVKLEHLIKLEHLFRAFVYTDP